MNDKEETLALVHTSDRLAEFGSFRLTPTGLVAVPGAPFDEWVRVGDWFRRAESGMPWNVGDWWVFGEHEYGTRAAQAIDPEGTDRLKTYTNYGRVARRFEMSRRRDISWTHHEIVAALEPADQDRLLEDAIRERWSTRELRRRVKALTERPPANAPTLPFPDMPEQPTRETLGKRTDPHRQPRRRHIRWKLTVIEESLYGSCSTGWRRPTSVRHNARRAPDCSRSARHSISVCSP